MKTRLYGKNQARQKERIKKKNGKTFFWAAPPSKKKKKKKTKFLNEKNCTAKIISKKKGFLTRFFPFRKKKFFWKAGEKKPKIHGGRPQGGGARLSGLRGFKKIFPAPGGGEGLKIFWALGFEVDPNPPRGAPRGSFKSPKNGGGFFPVRKVGAAGWDQRGGTPANYWLAKKGLKPGLRPRRETTAPPGKIYNFPKKQPDRERRGPTGPRSGNPKKTGPPKSPQKIGARKGPREPGNFHVPKILEKKKKKTPKS